MDRSMEKTRRLVGMSIFTALVIVLQVVATFVKFGPFSITLALTPIVVGSAVYGRKTGAWLGLAFGFVTLVMCIAGADFGGSILWNANAFFTAAVCLVKGAASGWCAGLVYSAVSKKNLYAGVICAAVVSPVVNTGLFILGMAVFFRDILGQWAAVAGQDVLYYAIIGLTGINFLVELLVNGALSPIVARLIRIRKKAA